MAKLCVGTSGWNYRGWRGCFYPDDLPSKQWLPYYAARFRSVEVNSSFYHLPRESTCREWDRQTPEDFVFALKASRVITHLSRLREVEEPWRLFVERAAALGRKLGPFLLQFPPSFRSDPENLERVQRFLASADFRRCRLAMEFRHRSCFEPAMLNVLRRFGVALVIAHSRRYPVPEMTMTADFAYFRFHGPREWCSSSYSTAELRDWAKQIRSLLQRGHDVFAYFNNDNGGHAIPNARSLERLVNSKGSDP